MRPSNDTIQTDDGQGVLMPLQARGVAGTRSLWEGVVRRQVTARNANLRILSGVTAQGLRFTADKSAVTGAARCRMCDTSCLIFCLAWMTSFLPMEGIFRGVARQGARVSNI